MFLKGTKHLKDRKPELSHQIEHMGKFFWAVCSLPHPPPQLNTEAVPLIAHLQRQGEGPASGCLQGPEEEPLALAWALVLDLASSRYLITSYWNRMSVRSFLWILFTNFRTLILTVSRNAWRHHKESYSSEFLLGTLLYSRYCHSTEYLVMSF